MFEIGALYDFAKEVIGYVKDAKSTYDAGKDIFKVGKERRCSRSRSPNRRRRSSRSYSTSTGSRSRRLSSTLLTQDTKSSSHAPTESRRCMYEIDPKANTKRRLVLKDGLTLVGKKVND